MRKLSFIFCFFSLFLLAACTQSEQTIESPEVVIQKFLTERPEASKTEAVMKMEVQDPLTSGNFSADYLIKQKSDVSDAKNLQQEGSFEAKIKVKQPESGLVEINAEAEMKVSGDDVYIGYKKFDMRGDFLENDGLTQEQAKQFNLILSTVIKPYLNDVFHVSFKGLRPLIDAGLKNIQMGTEMNFDFKALENYLRQGLKKDFANSKVIILSKDLGLEKIKNLSGKSVSTYHYVLALDSQGLERFIKTVNEHFHFVPSEELEKQLKMGFEWEEGHLEIREIVDIVNLALNIEVWIGQQDYQPYKTVINTNNEKLQQVLQQIEAIDKTNGLGSEAKKFFEKGEIIFNLTSNAEPIESFIVKKPTENIIDYGPFLQLLFEKSVEESFS